VFGAQSFNPISYPFARGEKFFDSIRDTTGMVVAFEKTDEKFFIEPGVGAILFKLASKCSR